MTISASAFFPPPGIVAVAVSGGADSLYSLLRLREQGVKVIAVHGLFARFQDSDASGDAQRALNSSDAQRDLNNDAQRVIDGLAAFCHAHAISFHVVDCSRAFVDRVVRPFVEAYAAGLTPNPCALCNAAIKFGLLLEKARALGADRLATGHYARLLPTDTADYSPSLLQGADPLKDQSYFLSLVPQGNLAAALFPLGELCKKEVLAALADRGVVVPQPGESQEVCFIPNDDYRSFLPGAARRFGIELPGPGPVFLDDGRCLGTHKGLWRYTEGQRRGLGIAWKEPLHVLSKDVSTNALYLGPRPALKTGSCVCRAPNVLLPSEYWPETVLVKTRYREKPKMARVEVFSDSLRIRFFAAESSVAPGQLAAVYVPSSLSGLPDAGEAPLRLVAGAIITAVEE